MDSGMTPLTRKFSLVKNIVAASFLEYKTLTPNLTRSLPGVKKNCDVVGFTRG